MKQSLLFLIAVLLVACSEPKKESVPEAGEDASMTTVPDTTNISQDTFAVSTVIPRVECKQNPAYSYALYLPAQYGKSSALPVIIFVDPHGDGALPLNMYAALAEKFGVILMGSNDSKNGLTYNQASPILHTLAAEAASRLNSDPKQISYAGFSGGAKAAMVAASELPAILSLVYCGAGLKELPMPLPPSLGITGKKDMNYTEVIETDALIGSKNFRHALVEWNGKHEWSDPSTFENAFYWIRFRAMEKKVSPVDEKLVQSFKAKNEKHEANPLQEERRLQKMASFLTGISDVSEYSKTLENLVKQPGYANAKKKQEGDLDLESRLKQNYLQCIELKDLFWWKDEVATLRKQSNSMNDRILAYISLACYSYSSNALKQRDLRGAEKYLGVYAMVDRENMDRAYMQACLYALRQNKAGMLESLKEAIRYGFKDRAKMESEPSFAAFRNLPEFNELLQELQ